MKAREIIDQVAHLLGDKDFEKIGTKLDAGEDLYVDEAKKVNRLISGLNIAVDTIASRYYMNVKEVQVSTDIERRVDYSALDERVYDILEVTDESGARVEFYSLPFSLYLPKANTKYRVKFKFLPRKVENLTDMVEILPFVPLSAVAYLMASDILLAKNLYDESKYWFSRFESIMTQAVSSRRMRSLGVNRLI